MSGERCAFMVQTVPSERHFRNQSLNDQVGRHCVGPPAQGARRPQSRCNGADGRKRGVRLGIRPPPRPPRTHAALRALEAAASRS
jgi:hypothetical protein